MPDAAHPDCRSAPGAAERKSSADSIGETAERDRDSPEQQRTNDSVPESTRIFHVAPLQPVWQGARLPKLQCRAHLPSDQYAPELSPLRTQRGGSKTLSRMRRRRADLRWLRHGKGGGEC